MPFKSGPSFTTPKGRFKFPSLHAIDYGTKDYPCPEGRYKTGLILTADDPEVKAFIAKLRPLYDAAEEMAKQRFAALKAETRKKLGGVKMNELFTELLDEATEEPTGEIEFRFKMAASGVSKAGKNAGKPWNRKPDIFDARGVLMKRVPEIWGGTIGKISFELGVDQEAGIPGYFVPGTGAGGLSMKLKGAQIIDLVQGGERNASSHGFGAEEGGYSAADDQGGFEDETGASSGGYVASADAGDSDF